MAIALRRPNDARARPSSLLKSDDQYRKVFNEQHPIQLYLVCANLMRRVDEYLYNRPSLDRKDVTNLRYYVAMLAAMEVTRLPQPKASQVAALDLSKVTNEVIERLLLEAANVYEALGGNDQIAKDPNLQKRS